MASIINNLMGKKEEKKKEEVPDELPPLADEIPEKLPNPEEAKEAKQPEPEKVESPFKDLELKKQDSSDSAMPAKIGAENKPAVKEEPINYMDTKALRREIATKEPSSEKANKTLEKKEQFAEKDEEQIVSLASSQGLDEEEKGFFSEIYSLISRQGINPSLLNQDLLRKMKDFWYFHPSQEWRFKNKERLQQDIVNELTQLKRVEGRWIAQRNFLEEDRRQLLDQERDIKSRTEKLQKILNQLKFYDNVPPNKYFRFNNGLIAKNLFELMNILEVIDDVIFNYHVNQEKNDIGNWIRYIVGEERLANEISLVKQRLEAIAVLENALLGKLYGIDPSQYFKTHDGRLLRNIKELLYALKDMDEPTFKSHITKEGNDFGNWIRYVFKNDFLADKLNEISSKEEAIKLIQNFYSF